MVLRRLKRISDLDKAALIKALERFFHAREGVVFALLYGSIVELEIPEKYGDIDIAVYVKPEDLKIPGYVLESKFEAEAHSFLSSMGLNLPPLEIIVINNAPYAFLVKLFKGKYIILMEDEEALADFIEEVGGRSMVNYHLRSESLREVLEG